MELKRLKSGNPAPNVARFWRKSPNEIALEAMNEILQLKGGWQQLPLDNQLRRWWSRRGPTPTELVELGIQESQAFLTLLAQKMSEEGYAPGEHEFPWEEKDRLAREAARLELERQEVIRSFEQIIPGGVVHLEWWSGAIPSYRGSFLQRGNLRWDMLPSMPSDDNYHFRWSKPSEVENPFDDGEDDILSFVHPD